MHVPIGHSFPDATGVAFALGLGPPSLLAPIFIIVLLYFFFFGVLFLVLHLKLTYVMCTKLQLLY